MKRTLLAMAMVLALATSIMAPAAIASSDGVDMTGPAAGQIFYEDGLIDLTASITGEVSTLFWAVRTDCRDSNTTLAGNVDGKSTAFTFDDGYFAASIDSAALAAGRYCFTITVDFTSGERDSMNDVEFYVVDEYAKVGGNVDNAGYLEEFHSELDLKELRGRQLSHAFEGVVGNAGSAGTVGSITVNYRQLDEYKVFGGKALSLGAAGGIGVTDPTARAAVVTVGGSEIILLDKDASPSFERGAAIVRYLGSPSMSKYEIDSTPGAGGADSWVPLVNGNVEVGTR